MATDISFDGGHSPRPYARRYDLDWLRVFAFGILIFYHVGMFYVTWGWHVKSPSASPALEPAMLLVNPWRLALLFFISGVAIRFAADKAPLADFLPGRFVRLFVPLVFGMLVVVVPQAYAELRFKGEIGPGFLAFWRDYVLFRGDFSIITPTWNHLWYIAYMLVYTLLLAPFLKPLTRLSKGGGELVFAWLAVVGMAPASDAGTAFRGLPAASRSAVPDNSRALGRLGQPRA